jgi:DNA-directed RNA polymerase specialized sigma subunit
VKLIDRINRIAYWKWRSLPPHYDLDDIQSVARLAAIQSRDGEEIVRAKYAIIEYLRKENPGSRGAGRLSLTSIWWMPVTTQPSQERLVLAQEERRRVMAAVDLLTVKELCVIRECFWLELPQREIARRMKTTEFYISRLKALALAKLRITLLEAPCKTS